MSGLISLGRTGASWTCFMATLTASGPSKGSLPVAASYMTMPSEYRSLAGVRSLPCACSGEM